MEATKELDYQRRRLIAVLQQTLDITVIGAYIGFIVSSLRRLAIDNH